MMLVQPFLYLPDALSLALLIAALILLRRSAVAHVRQELLRLRKDMILYWSGSGLSLNDPEYLRVSALLVGAAAVAPCLSPAHCFFLDRLVRRGSSGVARACPAIPSFDSRPASGKTKIKLDRISLESNLAVGSFFLLGSLSGWMVTCFLLIRLAARKIRGRKAANPASVFDLAEKLISRIGFHAMNLARLVHPRLGDADEQA